MDHNYTIKHRIDSAFFQIIELHPLQRNDLQKMWRVARSTWNELDQELVACRIHKRPSSKYKEIEQNLLERLDTIEQYLTFALLTK